MSINFNPYLRSRTGNVRGMLKGVKYKLDYYQRDYVWSKDNVLQFLADLTDCFLESYRPAHERDMVAKYSHYYLGEITTCKQGPYVYIIDGQQRLTTLTLLLLLLRNLQEENNVENPVNVDKLIYSTTYGQESFNLNIEERIPYMEALYNNKPYEMNRQSKSVMNIDQRYRDMREYLESKLPKETLPYFTKWLLNRVNLVEISVEPIEISNLIFRILNDRGLPVRPVELLKGFLLENIASEKRADAENLWNNLVVAINELGNEKETDCIKNWFWSKYAQDIGSDSEKTVSHDFERIGNEFHRWLNDERERIGLQSSDDYFQFINNEFRFYSQQYAKISKTSQNRTPELESVQHIAELGAEFTPMVLLAPLKPCDSNEVIDMKIQMTAHFIEILLERKLWDGQSIRDADMMYTMFNITKDIRNLDLNGLTEYFTNYLARKFPKFEHTKHTVFGLDRRNERYIHWILARITDYVEREAGLESQLDKYLKNGPDGYELEHLLPEYPTTTDEEDDEAFATNFFSRGMYDLKRNFIGALILLPKPVKDKINSLPYVDKLNCYKSENILASSLHPDIYESNSRFSRFVENSTLPFKPHLKFGPDGELTDRCLLYCKIADQIWSPMNFSMPP